MKEILRLLTRYQAEAATADDRRRLAWLNAFLTRPPGIRVVVNTDGFEYYAAGSTGVVLTHADDGTSLVLFDNPSMREAAPSKPAAAWWASTEDLTLER